MEMEERQDSPVYSLPTTGFVKLIDIIGDRRRGVPGLIPMSKASWYIGIKSGAFPPPVKLLPGGFAVGWKAEDIWRLIQRLGER